jgi:hypothetical protein
MTTQEAVETISTGGIQYTSNDKTWTLVSEAPDEGPYTLERTDQGIGIQYSEQHDTLADAIASAEEIAPLSEWQQAEW